MRWRVMHASTQGGSWAEARLLRESERVARDGVLDGGEPLVELLDVRLAGLLVVGDGREGVRHPVIPRVEVGHDFAPVVELKAVLVAAEPLQHGGHHQLTSEQRHEACAGSVLTRLADARGDLLAVDAELESLARLQRTLGWFRQLGLLEIRRGVEADQAAPFGAALHRRAAEGGLVTERKVHALGTVVLGADAAHNKLQLMPNCENNFQGEMTRHAKRTPLARPEQSAPGAGCAPPQSRGGSRGGQRQ